MNHDEESRLLKAYQQHRALKTLFESGELFRAQSLIEIVHSMHPKYVKVWDGKTYRIHTYVDGEGVNSRPLSELTIPSRGKGAKVWIGFSEAYSLELGSVPHYEYFGPFPVQRLYYRLNEQ